MGRRSGTETLAVVLLAFLEQRTWKQADLARRASVERKQIVRVLDDLQQAGLPLEREEDHPHVYWSVPRQWFPGAVAVSGENVSELVRLLQLVPRSEKRDQMLSRIGAMATGVSRSGGDAVITRPLSPAEEAGLTVLQKSAGQKLAAHVRYYTQSRGEIAWRFLSVHRILVEQRRFVATCHRTHQLKWFRLAGVIAAELTAQVAFRGADDQTVEQLLDESVDGYHSGTAAIRCVFRVNPDDARWVQAQLPLPCEIHQDDLETVFTAFTAGLLPLARFLVGLGRAARIDTAELRLLVTELARGALGELEAESTAPSSNTEHPSGAPIGTTD